MNERQNVALIQKLFEAFGRGDVQTILSHCTPDCAFYCPGPAAIPYAGSKKGAAEIQSYFSNLIGTQSNADLRIDQFVAEGNSVVAIGRYTAKVDATGRTIESPVALTFEVEGGKVTRHMVFHDTAAIAAGYAGGVAAAV
jgi:uncharacterized protein